jgi:hypothetical protein
LAPFPAGFVAGGAVRGTPPPMPVMRTASTLGKCSWSRVAPIPAMLLPMSGRIGYLAFAAAGTG